MKTPVGLTRICAVTAILVGLMIAWGVAYVRTHSPHPDLREYSKVLAAAADYGHRLQAEGATIPSLVTLKELIARGAIRPAEVRSFEGLEVTVALNPTNTGPEETLMSVTFPDGLEVVALGDGSIHQRSKR